jgi:peptide/nickel transport system permease protein
MPTWKITDSTASAQDPANDREAALPTPEQARHDDTRPDDTRPDAARAEDAQPSAVGGTPPQPSDHSARPVTESDDSSRPITGTVDSSRVVTDVDGSARVVAESAGSVGARSAGSGRRGSGRRGSGGRGSGRRGVWSRWGAAVRTPLGVSAAGLLLVVLVLAVVGPVVWGGRADVIDTDALSQGSSGEHLLGTDSLGRDILYRILVATRLSVQLALLATALGVAVGIILGALPWLLSTGGGWLGRRGGRFATAIVNIAVAFPSLLLALFFAVVFGVGIKGAVLAIGFATAPWYARVTQTLIAGIQARDFIAAARIAGIGKPRILTRHILPNIGEPLVVNATIGAGGALLAFAGLSFLGLGVQAPRYDWGLLLNEGLNGIYVRPAGAIAPGVAIVLAGLAFNLFGEAVAKNLGLRTARISASSLRTAKTPATDVTTSDESSAQAGTQNGQDAGLAVARDAVLVVDDLTVTVPGRASTGGGLTPVRGVSFTIGKGEAVGVVGESGSGKSLTALAVARLLEEPVQVTAGRLEFLGTDLLATSTSKSIGKSTSKTNTNSSGNTSGNTSGGTSGSGGSGTGTAGTAAAGGSGVGGGVEGLLGTSFGLVFQDPTTSFNPTMRVGAQLAEVARAHQGMNRGQASARAVERLRDTRVPAAVRRAGQYPHEFSGGMRQRAMVAMAIMGDPALIVADEPTTALDVTVQRQVLQLLQRIRTERDLAILLISHDITVVSQVCDRVLVMYAGRIVEDLPADRLHEQARHPYTRMLLAAVPDMTADRDQPLAVIPGRPVDPAHQPPGCAFAARCPLADQGCVDHDPALVSDRSGHRVACWHAGQPLPDPTTSDTTTDAVPVAVAAGGVGDE